MDFFSILSMILKYVFIIIIYLFVFQIAKMIFQDIKSTQASKKGAYLKLIDDEAKDKIYPIRESLSVGRDRYSDIRLDYNFISKNHFIIEEDGGEYYLRDLGSKNGTYVNGTKIDDEVILEDGDVIEVNDIKFVFVNREL
ncbi:FHA domain-containing protein [Fenollaria sporofastidiosus]|uniref:FHA domain-containing protein n=1 Tax=Fenollaria sporofastidiosus TaxID=2811778 RepID=UPI001C005D3A|nr:FHA domain-containing protein [Fenollaria sporofastidiosus]